MRSDSPGDRLRRREPEVVDALIALLLLAALQLELAFVRDHVDGPVVVNAVGGVCLTAPLAWRRRAPLAVALAFPATSLAVALLDGGLFGGEVPLFTAIVSGVVAFYSLGAHAERDRVAAAGAICGVLVIWTAIVIAGDRDLQSFGFSGGLVVAAPWLAGRAQRSRNAREAALHELTKQMAREQEQRERLAVSDERSRIARELHDIVAHSMGVMVVQAQGARRVLDQEPERARAALRSIEDTGRGALAEVRRSLGVLRREGSDAALEPQPGIGDLGALVEQAGAAGLAVATTVEGEARVIPTGVELSVYRIVQEALTNTIRHAGATRAAVTVRYDDDRIEVEVADDGVGPSTNGSEGQGGHGLVGMRERVALYGGDLHTGRGGAGGYVVRARIPTEP